MHGDLTIEVHDEGRSANALDVWIADVGTGADALHERHPRRNADDVAGLLGQSRAAMAFLDPPYNVRVRDIVGRGQIKHSEFAMASGELSRPDFVELERME